MDDDQNEVDQTDPFWYPLFLKELLENYPKIYEKVAFTVIMRVAVSNTGKGGTTK